MEIADFAAALRGMADNVDVLAERHDVAQMAQLRREADERAVLARRDGDLIDELRRQLAVSNRSLDAITRLRRNALTSPGDKSAVIQIFADALVLLAGPRCSLFTSGDCAGAGRTRGAPCLADARCTECVARDALERAGVRVEDGETK